MILSINGALEGIANTSRPGTNKEQVRQVLNHPWVFEPINRCITMYCIFGNWKNIAMGYAGLTVLQNRRAFNTVVEMYCEPEAGGV